jgi:hypothetical protein
LRRPPLGLKALLNALTIIVWYVCDQSQAMV